MEPEIVVQDLPKSLEREHAVPEVSSIEGKGLLAIIDDEETPFTMIEEHLYSVLAELQMLHDTANKMKVTKITMKRITFTTIATTIQKAWEQLKAAQHAHEENIILNSLKHIQASIVSLEQKYEDIQAKITENNTEIIFSKLNEIQVIINHLENKYEAIESTIKEAPKIYADIIKITIINMRKKAIAEMRARQRQQCDTLHQE